MPLHRAGQALARIGCQQHQCASICVALSGAQQRGFASQPQQKEIDGIPVEVYFVVEGRRRNAKVECVIYVCYAGPQSKRQQVPRDRYKGSAGRQVAKDLVESWVPSRHLQALRHHFEPGHYQKVDWIQ